MGRKVSTGSRLDLGDPALEGELLDFCEAHYGSPRIGIIRRAVREFIAKRLDAEPEMRKRFDEARRQRVGAKEPVVRLVSKDC